MARIQASLMKETREQSDKQNVNFQQTSSRGYV